MKPTPEELHQEAVQRWLDARYSRRGGAMTDAQRKAGVRLTHPFFKKYGG